MITALTAQNTRGVTGIHDVPPDFVTAQIDAVFSDLAVGAVKIGMLSQVATIEAVADGLERHKQTNVVLDPVMVATSGDRLLKPDAIETLRRLLIPRALRDHAEPAGGRGAARHRRSPKTESGDARPGRAAARARRQGGADQGRPRQRAGERRSSGRGRRGRRASPRPRIDTRNTHGTGCTLSSAIAAGLAKGLDLADAVRAAKDYVTARDRRLRPAQDRLRPRPGASFSPLVVSVDADHRMR